MKNLCTFVVSLCLWQAIVAEEASPTAMAMNRMQWACAVQPNSTMTEMFAGCLGDKGLIYTLPEVMKPCKEFYTGVNDLGSWQGVWDVTCGNQCSVKERFAECVVQGIKKKAEEANKDLLEVSTKACEICKVCVDEIGEKLKKGGPAPAAGRR